MAINLMIILNLTLILFLDHQHFCWKSFKKKPFEGSYIINEAKVRLRNALFEEIKLSKRFKIKIKNLF